MFVFIHIKQMYIMYLYINVSVCTNLSAYMAFC